MADSVTKAAAEGSRLEVLRALRAVVAEAVDDRDTPKRDLAALTRRLMGIIDEIAAIEAQMDQTEDSVAAAAALADEPFDGTFT